MFVFFSFLSKRPEECFNGLDNVAIEESPAESPETAELEVNFLIVLVICSLKETDENKTEQYHKDSRFLY